MGFVSLVGGGPGDPGLITVAGLRRIEQADVIVYDRLVGEELLTHARADAERVYVGKESNRHTMTQDEINAVLVDRGSRGLRVCRLKGGDPFVFGRGGEEALACVEAGIPFEVIPGVTSAIAAPAYAGIPISHRKIAASFAIITGHEDPSRSESAIDWERLAVSTDTLVFLMGIERLDDITSKLIHFGRVASTPAAVVQWGTTPRQRTVTAPLDQIAACVKNAGITAPAVTIVGEVVTLREKIAWFDRRPLFGERILVTRSREQASDLSRLLADAGASVIEFPTIRIRPYSATECPNIIQTLAQGFSWIVFTSVNAVQCFFSLVREAGGDARSVGSARIAAVGPVTAEAVDAAGLRVDFIPAEATSTRIAASFPTNLQEQRVLIPRALVAPDDMPAALRSRGADVSVLPVYETIPVEGQEGVREQVTSGQIDSATFTSSSTVTNFLQRIPASEVPPKMRIACIGPLTAETARSSGLRVDIVAEEHTVPGLVAAVIRASGMKAW